MFVLATGLAACTGGTSGSSASGPVSATAVKDANALVESGLRAQNAGQLTQALRDYEQATAKDPRIAVAYYDIGVIHQQQHGVAAAEQAYERALAVDPKYKPALFNLAILLTPTDPVRAESIYRQLLTLNSEDADVNFNLGLLLIDEGKSTEGHEDLRKAIALDPSLAQRVPAGITP